MKKKRKAQSTPKMFLLGLDATVSNSKMVKVQCILVYPNELNLNCQRIVRIRENSGLLRMAFSSEKVIDLKKGKVMLPNNFNSCIWL